MIPIKDNIHIEEFVFWMATKNIFWVLFQLILKGLFSQLCLKKVEFFYCCQKNASSRNIFWKKLKIIWMVEM